MQPSYRAFKAIALEDLNGRCSNRGIYASFQQQQLLLRAHLRHALLAAKSDDGVRAAGDSSRVQDDGKDEGGAAWMDRIRRSVAAETLQQEADSTKKQRGAALLTSARLQQRVRKLGQPDLELSDTERTPHPPSPPSLASRIHNKATLSETRLVNEDGSVNLDLNSTSRFIPLQQQQICDSFDDPVIGLTVPQTVECDHELDSFDAQENTQSLHAFELVIKLLSARDLAIPNSFPTTSRVRIGAELSLVHQTKQIAVLSAPPVSFLAAMDDTIHWDDAALRFGFDSPALSSDTTTTCYDPQSVINEWSLSILVQVVELQSGTNTVLGKIEVPLALLETPLAQEYAMARWFPLERTSVGVPTRGDIRVSITLSMRDDTSGDDKQLMVAYKSKLESSSGPGVASKRTNKSSQLRRGSRKASTSTALSKKPQLPGSKTSPQRGTRGSKDMNEQLYSGSSSPPPSVATAGASRRKFSQPRPVRPISPSYRCPKVGAFSPPSSPSSFSSENLDESRSPRSSPAPSQQQPGRRSSLAPRRSSRQRAVDFAEAEAAVVAATVANTSTQPFLKRKPYKVVFRKLDWSSVGSRTDSSWDAKQPSGTQASGAASAGLQSPTGAATPLKKRGKQLGSDSQGRSDGNIKKSSVELDPAIVPRLQALSSAVYECCCVTQTTAPLAHMKYQAERTKHVQQLQASVTTSSTGGESLEASTAPSDECDPQLSSKSFLTSSIALSGLWKALVNDAGGELYASRLQQLLSGVENACNPADLSTKA